MNGTELLAKTDGAIVSKGSLIPCLSFCRGLSLQLLYTVSASRWREGRWIWFPRKRVCLWLLELHGFIQIYLLSVKKAQMSQFWHKQRWVVKLSVKYKLLLACFILRPKFTPQYFLSTFAYLPILGHPTRPSTLKSAYSFVWSFCVKSVIKIQL